VFSGGRQMKSRLAFGVGFLAYRRKSKPASMAAGGSILKGRMGYAGAVGLLGVAALCVVAVDNAAGAGCRCG
jgi:hypothetical protein